jgi:hypothetical protein
MFEGALETRQVTLVSGPGLPHPKRRSSLYVSDAVDGLHVVGVDRERPFEQSARRVDLVLAVTCDLPLNFHPKAIRASAGFILSRGARVEQHAIGQKLLQFGVLVLELLQPFGLACLWLGATS